MSHFVETVKRLMKENDVIQIEISRKTDLIPSHVSHILNEKQQASPEITGKFAKAITRSQPEQAQIIRAFLQDQLPPIPASRLIEIDLRTEASVMNDAPKFPTRLAPDLEQALQTVAKRCITDSNMRELVLRISKYA